MNKILISLFLIVANSVSGQSFRIRVDPTPLALRADEIGSPTFELYYCPQEVNWGYHPKIFKLHHIGDRVVYGDKVRECIFERKGLYIECPFQLGDAYRFSIAEYENCQDCIRKFEKLEAENPRIYKGDLDRKLNNPDRGYYFLHFYGSEGWYFLLKDPDRLFKYGPMTESLTDSWLTRNPAIHVRSLRSELGKKISIKPIKVPPGKWKEISDPEDDYKRLPLYRDIAKGAYTLEVGAKISGYRLDWASKAGEVNKSYTTVVTREDGVSTEMFEPLALAEYIVTEVIEGAPCGPFDTVEEFNNKYQMRVHPILGEIPMGFRAIILSDCKDIDDKSHKIIGYAGTGSLAITEPDWLFGNIPQGIPIFKWPWERDDSKFDANVSYGTVSYDAPDTKRVASFYSFALDVAKYVLGQGPKPEVPIIKESWQSDDFVVCGHSLGGGLANFVSAMLGVRGYGYNSAALASGAQVVRNYGVPFPDIYFTHIRSSLDPVSIITSHLWKGELIGAQFIVGSHAFVRFFQDHPIDSMDVENIIDYIPPDSAEIFR